MKREDMLEIMIRTWKDYTATMDAQNNGVKGGMELVLKAQEYHGIRPPSISKYSKPDEYDLEGHWYSVNSWGESD